jgi:GH35 family endo-1,4-beta-xylanase
MVLARPVSDAPPLVALFVRIPITYPEPVAHGAARPPWLQEARMADELVVRFASVAGTPTVPTVMHTTNRRGFPFFSEWRQMAPGELAIRYAKEQPFGMEVLYEIPGFGRVMTRADNEGKLYRLGDPAVDFRAEAAKSRMATVRERASGVVPGGSVRERIQAAERGLALALHLPEGGQRARALDDVLGVAFRLGEELELERARAAIRAMGVQERRAKLFGAAFFDPDATEHYLFRFRELLNFATLPFYRRHVEPVEGRPDWDTRGRLLERLDRWGLERKGHPLSWWIHHGLPDWMRKLSYRTLKEVIYRQVYDTVTRYKDSIHIWDVINEAHDPIVKGNDLGLDREQVLEITALACKATREADPDAVRIVNVNRPWGDYRAEWEMMDPMHPIEYLEALNERGIEYEVNGVQMYHGGPEHYVRDMVEQSALVDQYLALGKPVHISEVQTPSSIEAEPDKWLGGAVAPSGWWHRPWDAEVQADWVEHFYTIMCSKPNLQAITWWSLSDRRSFWPHGGLLDRADQPKPAYDRLLGFVRGLTEDCRAVP